MAGLVALIVVGFLVGCAVIVLALCARAPRIDDPDLRLSRLDRWDGRGAGGLVTTTDWRVPDEPGRVA